jgi:SAM-dependent methyltransferase
MLEQHLPNAKVAFGVGPFEKSLMERLALRGFWTMLVDVRSLAVGTGTHPYLETWQRDLTPARLQKMAELHGKADIVSCRYLLEHCYDPVAALKGLQALLQPGGFLAVELPDSSKFIKNMDYSFLWEEHVSYFTEQTLRQLALRAGFDVVELMRFEGRLEDAFVVLLRPALEARDAPAIDSSELQAYERYRVGFDHARVGVQAAVCSRMASTSGGVALFGLGHQAIMFTNMMRIAPMISAAVDDDANKWGHFAPGFSVPVITSAEFALDDRVHTCLLAVNPSVEHKIKDKLAPLVNRGVQFHSMFAGVSGSFLLDLPPWR